MDISAVTMWNWSNKMAWHSLRSGGRSAAMVRGQGSRELLSKENCNEVSPQFSRIVDL